MHNKAHQTALLALALLMHGCGGAAPSPTPGVNRGTPPDLRGRRVLVLPVQQNVGVAGNVDAEIAFGLQSRSDDVEWILPAEIEEILDRSPGVQAQTRGLPVAVFLQAEVDRIGDPLYGELRRMSALVDAEVVLIPIGMTMEAQEEGDPTVSVTAVLIGPRTGRVAWFGVVEGGAFPAGDPRGLASAVDALAQRLLWYVGDEPSPRAETVR